MNVERLTKLAELMDRIKPTSKKKFDLQYWKKKTDCGTSACAVGWACSDPWFKEQGLKLKTDVWSRKETETAWDVYYDDWRHFAAVARFFDIREYEAEHLFMPGVEYSKPADVASRVREFIKKKAMYQVAAS